MSHEHCHGKPRYTKKEALTVLNRRTKGRRNVRHGRPAFLRVYECACGGWHLTSKEHYDSEE